MNDGTAAGGTLTITGSTIVSNSAYSAAFTNPVPSTTPQYYRAKEF